MLIIDIMCEVSLYTPSSSSKLAPPPVETWLTLSSVFHLAQHVAVSPPPIIVIVPFLVASTTASIMAFVPLEKFSNSNTPAGLKKNLNYSIVPVEKSETMPKEWEPTPICPVLRQNIY